MRFLETKRVRLRRLRRIRCVACDLDGTLLTSDNAVSPGAVDAAADARERGIHLVLASGRTDAFTRRYAREIGTDAPVISLNGALAKESNGTPLVSYPLPEGVAAAADELAMQLDPIEMSWSLFTADGIISRDEQPVLPRYLRTEVDDIRPVRDLRPYYATGLLLCAGGTYNALQHLSVTLATRFGKHLHRSFYQSGGSADRYYLEVKIRGVNKATALRAVIERLGVSRRETAAIGDYSNDLEMCTFAGVSAAMRNGHADLKSAADYLTQRDHNEGGVAEFLRLILEGRAPR
ncbi:MAG: HAD family hydrolase [Bacteroidota bacterium]|jgi:Cof subfamily protein (haloacid dehalogenase superfamily)|nr:HAD family hydrolase [Bacteroidota bacterium]